jgi:hypothetical protein
MGARFDFSLFCSLSEANLRRLPTVRQRFALFSLVDGTNNDCEPRQDKPNPTHGFPNTHL